MELNLTALVPQVLSYATLSCSFLFPSRFLASSLSSTLVFLLISLYFHIHLSHSPRMPPSSCFMSQRNQMTHSLRSRESLKAPRWSCKAPGQVVGSWTDHRSAIFAALEVICCTFFFLSLIGGELLFSASQVTRGYILARCGSPGLVFRAGTPLAHGFSPSAPFGVVKHTWLAPAYKLSRHRSHLAGSLPRV